MNISIAIADSNREYRERLAEVLQQYSDLTIYKYASCQKIQADIEKYHFDVVLFDPDISDQRIVFPGVKLPMCLYSEEAQNKGMYTEVAQVIKYQRISNIYKEIVRQYADKAGYSMTLDHSQDTQMIAVYSPIGGSGKTTVALTVASRLTGFGKNVLFISMEQLNSSICVNPKQEEGITALVQSVTDEHTNFELKLKGLLKQGINGMWYIEGFDRIVDYSAVKDEEITEVLKGIRSCGEYDYVVIDMESNIDALGREVMEIADYIFVVEKPGELPAVKMELFARQAIVDEYNSKMIRVCNFADNHSSYCKDVPFGTVGTINHYGNLQMRSIIKAINANEEINLDQILSGK